MIDNEKDRYPTYIEALDKIEVLEKALELACNDVWKNTTYTPNAEIMAENYIHRAKEELGILKAVCNVKN